MAYIDWLIIAIYISAMIALGFFLGRNQVDFESYYVGDRKFSWWPIGVSVMATQTSAISFISIPAFVALADGGGLNWLQYELALPLAMLAAVVFLVPFFRELNLVSIYEYLEKRFDRKVRLAVSLMFLLSRGLGTGVALYAAAIVLTVCFGLPIYLTIAVVGIGTIIYDVAGGIRAVIISDVIQIFVLILGIVVCLYYAIDLNGGIVNTISALPNERAHTFDFSLGFSAESKTPFWAFLVGGFFLYLAYYGTDQSQAQRGLSAASHADAKKSLLLNGFCRFPLAFLYVLMGVAMFGALQNSAELQSALAQSKPDYLVPYFVLHELPSGFRGLLFAALLAATMSSLDSALNSLSAVTLRDFVEDRLKSKHQLLFWSRCITIAWGGLITGFAFFVGDISDTVIEAINKVGSAFYGPVLATFFSGILIKRTQALGVLLGLIFGVLFNLLCWLILPEMHWMWWNLFGFIIAVGVALIFSFFRVESEAERSELDASLVLSLDHIIVRERTWVSVYLKLMAYFFIILIVMALMSALWPN